MWRGPTITLARPPRYILVICNDPIIQFECQMRGDTVEFPNFDIVLLGTQHLLFEQRTHCVSDLSCLLTVIGQLEHM